MDEYWVDMNGDNEDFWSHEWNKHGTCINTIEPSCYSDYKAQEEVGDYFQKTVELFKTLDTYKVWFPLRFMICAISDRPRLSMLLALLRVLPRLTLSARSRRLLPTCMVRRFTLAALVAS
jgi:hypothetical protein